MLNDNEFPNLHVATMTRHVSKVSNFLKEKEIDVNVVLKNGSTPLSCAAAMGYDEIIKLFLSQQNIMVNEPDDRGLTPLHKAASSGHYVIVQYFIYVVPVFSSKKQRIPNFHYQN